MSVSSLSKDSKSIVLERNKVITVTTRTVRYGAEVYQTHNIAGFGEGEVAIGGIPWIVLILMFLASLFCFMVASIEPQLGSFRFLLLIASLAGVIYNTQKPKHYGFLITLNSGDKKLFITTDKSGLKQITSTIYDILEKDKEATYQVVVKNSQITGNFIQGDVGGNMSFNED
ncbi:MAG: DUF6232 family protein [Cyanobacteria bacterium P01_H01_bin.150]